MATKHDLEAQDLRSEAKLEALENRVRGELMAMQRHIVSTVLTVVPVSNLTLAGLAFAAARLF